MEMVRITTMTPTTMKKNQYSKYIYFFKDFFVCDLVLLSSRLGGLLYAVYFFYWGVGDGEDYNNNNVTDTNDDEIDNHNNYRNNINNKNKITLKLLEIYHCSDVCV